MIDLRSSAVVEKHNHRPCYSPSPWGEGWGSNERSECRFVCCSDVGELTPREPGERHFLCYSFVGELNPRERSARHSLYRSLMGEHATRSSSRAMHLTILSFCPNLCAAPRVACAYVAKIRFYQTNPFPPWSFKAFQRDSKRFKAIQRFWRKKLFIFSAAPAASSFLSANSKQTQRRAAEKR
jgi:hypothetical protein